ncbi:hypothetical protein BDBG_09038 [Blastomyces gilchristii SLH14081]|uniref:Uncharacterized protein n=1 Tax=Blastomyces gilchristii (strain SLH14081) TaxID=559298 RepID=A0A179V5L1_BLAGS|nr:uncharacterized protein BDBG_09038 [Blastomyces gilchristii SLH14081]EQL28516.1 hypothetical protein BDFG_08753 [Blastomyces dermatitidis ATCC 26199]OAT13932.1 hypothetical protein BDBG_09038 [Blastomyces gilchristii SLH14081]
MSSKSAHARVIWNGVDSFRVYHRDPRQEPRVPPLPLAVERPPHLSGSTPPTRPISRIEYVAHISRGKVPCQVPEDGGIGNADFNAGKKVSKYAYEILDLWRLKQPISLKLAISNGLLKGPPQKYCCVPLALLESCPMDTQEHIISRAPQETPVEGEMKDYVLPEESKEAPSS